MTLIFKPDSFQDTSDYQLVKQFRGGNMEAFKFLYEKYGGKLYNFILSLLHDPDEAEDLTQNTFLKLWDKRTDLNPEKSVASYIFMIARHMVYRQACNRLMHNRHNENFTRERGVIDRSTEEQIDSVFLSMRLEILTNELPEARRAIFILSRIEGLSNREIAQRLGISEKTVETQLYRATQYIRKYRL